MSRLDGKVALITGSGRGIGQALALKLASEGARLVVNDLDPAPVQSTLELIRTQGGEAVACPGNVTAADFGDRFVATALTAGQWCFVTGTFSSGTLTLWKNGVSVGSAAA